MEEEWGEGGGGGGGEGKEELGGGGGGGREKEDHEKKKKKNSKTHTHPQLTNVLLGISVDLDLVEVHPGPVLLVVAPRHGRGGRRAVLAVLEVVVHVLVQGLQYPVLHLAGLRRVLLLRRRCHRRGLRRGHRAAGVDVVELAPALALRHARGEALVAGLLQALQHGVRGSP